MFTIEKNVDGAWKFYANRVRWADKPVLSGIFLDAKNVFAAIDLLPDGDEIGCEVMPLTITVDTDNPVQREVSNENCN